MLKVTLSSKGWSGSRIIGTREYFPSPSKPVRTNLRLQTFGCSAKLSKQASEAVQHACLTKAQSFCLGDAQPTLGLRSKLNTAFGVLEYPKSGSPEVATLLHGQCQLRQAKLPTPRNHLAPKPMTTPPPVQPLAFFSHLKRFTQPRLAARTDLG